MNVVRSDPTRCPDRSQDHRPDSPPGPGHAHRRRALPAALVAAAAAVALLVGRDGNAGWRGARVVSVAAMAVGGWWVLRRAGAVWHGLVALAAGLIATAVGVGIALPNVSKVGLTAISLAGLVCLAAGLVLVLGGAVIVLRATRPWWRFPIAVGLLVASYAVVFILGVAVAATNVPRTAVGQDTP
jgi:hypothetical protein